MLYCRCLNIIKFKISSSKALELGVFSFLALGSLFSDFSRTPSLCSLSADCFVSLVNVTLSSPKTQVRNINEFQSCQNTADGPLQFLKAEFREAKAISERSQLPLGSLSTSSPCTCIFCFLFSNEMYSLPLHWQHQQ